MSLTATSILSICLSLFVVRSLCDYADDEERLLEALRTNYSIDHRPFKATLINTTLALFALNKLDIGAEVMSVSIVIANQWRDSRLAWDPADYNNITQLVIPINYIWTPPLIIENEVNKVGVLGADKTPLRVMYLGLVFWTPIVTATTSCAVDITYYPYDKQTCIVVITGWSYTVDEVELVTNPELPVTTKFFSENGEWELISTDASLVNLSEESATYRKIHFNLTFRRKWQFYGQNIIIPLVLNSLLMAMVFVVPVESGEKMGYCLTVLLSYIVLLTMVSENLPANSSNPSVIQIYLCTVMCIGTLGTVCTIAILRLYNKDEAKPVPRWLQLFTQYIVAPCTCKPSRPRRVVSPDTKEFAAKNNKMEHIFSYKEIAIMIDSLFFRFFALLMLSCTIMLLTLLHSNYY